MSYTAFKTMREVNKERFGKDLGPKEPPLYRNRRRPNDLKSSALRFLHERCEGLRFVDEAEAEFFGALCTGRSISSDQIP